MALIKTVLEQALKTKILALEPKLKLAFDSKASGLFRAQFNADAKALLNPPKTGFGQIPYKKKLWETTADEWGSVIAKEVIKIIAEDISDIIATEVTSYIKSATIISPAGQTTTPAALGAPVTTITPAGPSTIT